MSSYGITSTGRLKTCHDDLKLIFNTVAERYNNTVICGHRNEPAQTIAFDMGLSQLKFPNSKHNVFPSMAIDAGPYFPELRNLDWKDHKAFAYFAGYVKRVAEDLLERKLITHRLRWGGDWDGDGRTLDETFLDLVHFELIKAEG